MNPGEPGLRVIIIIMMMMMIIIIITSGQRISTKCRIACRAVIED